MTEVAGAQRQIRTLVTSTFSLNGYTLKEDSRSFLVELLQPFDKREREEWLDRIIALLQEHTLESAVIRKEQVESVLKTCARSVLGETETVLNIISAFEVPKFTYNLDRKKFEKAILDDDSHNIFGNAKQKCFLFQERYTILLQRTNRHELFAPAVLGMGNEDNARLYNVEYFLSSSDRIGKAVCLGLLTQLREGQYCLEDPTGVLPLDLTNTRYHTGLHTENCFVLAEGFYEDSVFHVEGMGFPPPESSKSSRAYFGNLNTFGGPSAISLKSSPKLLKYEQDNPDEMIVFVSDVWLDDSKVIEKLTQLFEGYSENPPVAFVLIGNFLSTQHRDFQTHVLKAKFKALADIVVGFPDLVQKSKFIFVPGPADCGAAHILPRPPLPEWVTEDFQTRVASSVFATNPCRIQYATKEITVIREDLVTKMCRNAIHFPTTGNIADHFVRTVLCQAHAAPLTASVCPVYWAHDAALRLYPAPDLLITADRFAPFSVLYSDCLVVNPGSFPTTEYSFKVYLPAQQVMEDSQIPSE